MRIIEIESQILINTKQIREFQKQVSELSKVNSNLSQTKEIKLLEMFTDYIQLGSTYTFNSYAYLNGVQTGVKNKKMDSISFISPNFSSGDSIEFVKKNKKSLVIKCVTKIISKIENLNGVRTKHVTNPNWIFRISIVSLYNYMIKNTEFKSRFDAYVRRKESLELLGI
jgi:hypothetical protein